MIATHVYDIAAEQAHWWFRSRRHLIDWAIHSMTAYRENAILEIGCGSGGNLPTLAKYGNVVGVDIDPDALAFANRGRSEAWAVEGNAMHLPQAWGDGFDILLAADMLEHIVNDRQVLREAYRVLQPGGFIVITVPAMPSLWGPHDETLGHQRRYTRGELLQKARNAGFQTAYCTHTMALLLPALWAHRHLLKAPWHKAATYQNPAARVPPWPANQIMEGIMATERMMLAIGAKWPLGVSLLYVGRKPAYQSRP